MDRAGQADFQWVKALCCLNVGFHTAYFQLHWQLVFSTHSVSASFLGLYLSIIKLHCYLIKIRHEWWWWNIWDIPIKAKDILINAYVPSKLIIYNLFKDICPLILLCPWEWNSYSQICCPAMKERRRSAHGLCVLIGFAEKVLQV